MKLREHESDFQPGQLLPMVRCRSPSPQYPFYPAANEECSQHETIIRHGNHGLKLREHKSASDFQPGQLLPMARRRSPSPQYPFYPAANEECSQHETLIRHGNHGLKLREHKSESDFQPGQLLPMARRQPLPPPYPPPAIG